MSASDVWKLDLGDSASSQPLLGGDVVIGSTTSTLRGIDLYTGKDRWTPYPLSTQGIDDFAISSNRVFFLGNPIDFKPVSPGSDLSEGNNLTDDGGISGGGGGISGGGGGISGGGSGGSGGKGLVVLDVGTGKYCGEWDNVVPGSADLMDPLVADGVLILRDENGMLYGYDAKSGHTPAQLWQVNLSKILKQADYTPGPAALGDNAAFFVIGSELVGVNVQSGQTRYRFPDTGSPLETGDSLPQISPPMVGNGLVVVLGEQAIYALDWRTGAKVWTVKIDSGDAFNTPVVSWEGDSLFFTTKNGKASGHVLSTGQAFWSSDLPTLAQNAHVSGQSRGFLRPIINTDVVKLDFESGHLTTDDRVFLPAETGAIFVLDVSVNKTTATPKYTVTVSEALENASGLAYAPETGNGMLLTTDTNGSIQAKAITAETAAYIDKTAKINIPYKSDYNFGADEFSIESWIRTSIGGDLITQSPDKNGNGFRLAIVSQPDGIMAEQFGEGRVQFTIGDPKGNVLLFAQSMPTQVADGAWHHVTVVRKGNSIAIFVDGVSQPVTEMIYRSLVAKNEQSQLPPATQQKYFPPDIVSENTTVPSVANSNEAIIVGAYEPSSNTYEDANSVPYEGLVADLRIWKTAVTAKQVQNRMSKLLTGHEPSLAGYWPLNQKSPTEFKNATDGTVLGTANVSGVQCLATNLQLDDSLFPYLLHGVTDTWPYKDRWTARAEDAPKWSPAGTGEVVCFATDRALYAIDLIHGTRKWGRDLTKPSPPSASPRGCFILDDTTLKSFDSGKGTEQWFTDLTQQAHASGARAVDWAPVITKGCVVCSADGKNFYWLNAWTGKLLGHYATTAVVEVAPLASGNRLYLVADDKVCAFEDPPASTETPESMAPVASAPVSSQGTVSLCVDGGRLFLCDGTWVAALDSQSLQSPDKLPKDKTFAWNPPAITGEQITGMAASANANTLMLATNNGKVLFWEFGSGKLKNSFTIPDLPGAKVFPPVIVKNIVFCTAAGTSKGGGVWAFDLKTGDLCAIDKVDAPPVGSPYVTVDTAFFGVDNGGRDYKTSKQLEGEAIHSAVLGSTRVLLREEGDNAITVSNVDPVFARTPAEETDQTNSFQDGDFTLEAWVNSQSSKGGEIISLPPGSVAGQPIAGFSLSMDDQGVLSAEHLKTGAGSAFKSQTTGVTDGRWHHVAAVFRYNREFSQQLCYLYLDGKQLAGVTHSVIASVPAAVQKREVTIGGSDAHDFHGLIDDVRVWATWLHAAEISTRRNVKLRGNEVDLLASWSFDTSGVKDASTNALNQPLKLGASQKIRLTDLNFVAPNYPYLLAQSKGVETVTKTDPKGHGATITTAKYQTTISARTADGSPRANTKIMVWASEKTNVSTTANPNPVTISDDQPADFTLDSDGKLTLDLSNKDVEHSPLLSVWADYMYENERFHVAPAVETQHHVVVPPPHLTAQSTVIQDYAYSPGDKLGKNHGNSGDFTLNESADVTTIHTTITAMTSAGDVLPNETLELWANGHLSIEVDNIPYVLTKENSAKFKTGPDGTLAVVLQENANPKGNLLDCPTLSVRAGFMPRSSRFVIAPAENANKTLSSVTGDQIYGDKPIAKGEQKKTLITKLKTKSASNAKKQAPAIASTLNQMASLAKKHQPATANVAGAAAGATTAPPSGAETMNSALLPPDSVESVHHSAHLPYHAPMTPEYMPSKHMVLSLQADGSLTHSTFDTTQELDDHLVSLGLSNSDKLFSSVSVSGDDDAAGGWFSSLAHDIKKGWNDLKHGVEHAWNKAKHFVVKTWDQIKNDVGDIVHQVEVVIADAAKAIGKWVVKTVKDVVDHVVSFLKKVWTLLKDIYNFLKALFDWKEILQVHDVLRDTFNNNLKGLEYEVGNTIPNEIDQWFTEVKTKLAKGLGVAGDNDQVRGSIGSQKSRISGNSGTCVSHSKSSKSKWMTNKLKGHATSKHASPPNPYGGAGTLSAPFTAPLFTSGSGASLNQDFTKMIGDFSTVLDQPGGLASVTVKELLNILDDVLNIVIDLAEDLLIALLDLVAFAVKQIDKLLNHELDIPFISALYELISGHPLTILDVLCLISAIPVHIVSSILDINFDQGESQRFLDGHQAFSTTNSASDAAGAGASTGLKFADVSYLLFSVVNGIVTGISDVVQGEANLADPAAYGGEGAPPEQPLSNMVLGTVSQFTAFGTGMLQWTVRTGEADTWRKPQTYLSTIPSVIHLAAGAYFIANRAKGETAESFGRLSKDTFGEKVGGTPIPLIISCIGLASTGYAVYEIVADSEDANAPAGKVGEDVMDLLSGINTLCAFLNWSVVNQATEVDEISLSSLGLAGLDIGVSSAANPVIHFAAGYGKEIL